MAFTFTVDRKLKGDINPPVRIASGLTSKNFTDDTVEQDKVYLYRASATDGAIEKFSDEVEVSTHSVAPTVIGTTASNFTTSTSQTKAIPSGTQVGDLIVAFVMHRDVLTVPSGFALVSQAEAATSAGVQYCSVYSKVATSADIDANATFSQATSQRLSLSLMSFRHARGCKIVNIVKSDYIPQVGAKIDFSEFTAIRNGVAVNFGGWAYSLAGETSYSVTSGYSALSITSTSDASNQIRSGVGYKTINIFDLNTGFFSMTLSTNEGAYTNTACSIGFLVTYL